MRYTIPSMHFEINLSEGTLITTKQAMEMLDIPEDRIKEGEIIPLTSKRTFDHFVAEYWPECWQKQTEVLHKYSNNYYIRAVY